MYTKTWIFNFSSPDSVQYRAKIPNLIKIDAVFLEVTYPKMYGHNLLFIQKMQK